jgi:hypothetical protein
LRDKGGVKYKGPAGQLKFENTRKIRFVIFLGAGEPFPRVFPVLARQPSSQPAPRKITKRIFYLVSVRTK